MKYKKPKITAKKIKLSLFLTRARSFSALEGLIASYTCPDVGCTDYGCLLPDTNVFMGDRTLKKIQDINVGDSVLSYNISSGSLVEKKVEELHVHEKSQREYLIINNTLKVTTNHPLWVNSSSWREAGTLNIGDTLFDSQGKKVKINRIDKIDDQIEVYDLSVSAPEHSYFAEDILVHNRQMDCGGS